MTPYINFVVVSWKRDIRNWQPDAGNFGKITTPSSVGPARRAGQQSTTETKSTLPSSTPSTNTQNLQRNSRRKSILLFGRPVRYGHYMKIMLRALSTHSRDTHVSKMVAGPQLLRRRTIMHRRIITHRRTVASPR